MRGQHHNSYRSASSSILARALVKERNDTLDLINRWTIALPSLEVPNESGLNPLLWEWGHIAWFQEWWTVRNRKRYLGLKASNTCFDPSIMTNADALYNSSQVSHATRWSLELPSLENTLFYMRSALDQSLERLNSISDEDDNTLYFWRLALFHEAMHNEASAYMAQSMGIELVLPDHIQKARDTTTTKSTPLSLRINGQNISQGHDGLGFAFDNELANHNVRVNSFEIDAQPINWHQYIGFLQESQYPLPPYVSCVDGTWQEKRYGRWQPLDMQACVSHVSAWDAQAWCEWAGRRLPTEAEWNCAVQHPDFEWGHVWEWTASPFAPFEGFEPHPYEDYSAPWWHTHRVLKGASWATPACLIDSRFRNFFMPDRHDIVCGFRTVAL